MFTKSLLLLLALCCYAQSVFGAGVVLTWDANPTPGVAGYKLGYGPQSCQYASVKDVGNVLTTTLDNLVVGQTYYFAIKAYGVDGAGASLEYPYSNEVQYTAQAAPVPNPTPEPTPEPTPNPTPEPTPPPDGSGYTCPCSFYAATVTPSEGADVDTNAVELGVKFKSDIDGYIAAIKFYKAPENTGPHVVDFWSSDGTKLGTGTSSAETASGWQTVKLNASVNVKAGTVYVASFHSPAGRYIITENAFTTAGVDKGPLHILPNGTSVNGVYKYGPAGSFPTNTWSASNYWVDVIFNPVTPTPPPPVPPPTPDVSYNTLFAPTDSPPTFFTENNSIELGVKFKSSVAGYVYGVRFYKGVENTGTHTGSLWAASGNKLASGTFANETREGWQTLKFSAPVAVTAGTTYVASYHTEGKYDLTENVFANNSTLVKAPLTATAGVYKFGTGSIFPNSTWRGTNYWVDVLFSTTKL